MSIFSTREKVRYGTTATRVIDDAQIISSVKIGTLKHLFGKDELSASINEEMLSSLAIKAKRYYKYAKDSYVYGLPSGQVLNPTEGTLEVQPILDALEGTPVLLDYCYFSDINFAHLAQHQLIAAYNYQSSNNSLQTLSTAKGYTVYLDYIILSMSRAKQASLSTDMYKAWGTPVRIVWDESLTTIKAGIGYSWSFPTGATDIDGYPIYDVAKETAYFTNDLTIADLDLDDDYFQARYVVGGQVKYWQYKAGLGTYPTLDAYTEATHVPAGSYLPFTLFRTAKVSMDAYVGQPIYETSKRLVGKLGLNYADVVEQINSNPDIADVEQAILIMAVPANTANQAEQCYLYRYFDSNFVAMGGQITALSAGEFASSFGPNSVTPSAIMIQDGYFGMGLSFTGLHKRLVTGVTAPVGDYSSSVGKFSYPVSYTSEDGFTYTSEVSYSACFYRKQVSATQYQEIQVVGISMSYFMYGMEISGTRKFHRTGDDLTNEALLLLPLDFAVSSEVPMLLREELYARSLHFVFNSVTVTKIKWYQTTIFKFIMIVVAIVILIFSWGSNWQALAWAVSLGLSGYVAVMAAILIEIALFMAAQYMVKLFVKAIGIKAAFAIAVIAMCYGVATEYGATNLSAGLSTQLLQLGSGIMQGVQLNLADAMEGVKDQALVAKAEQDKQWKLIEQAEELMDSPKLAPFIFFGESVDTYYERTAHSGNIGIIGLSAVSNYVERSLSLPTLPDKFGGYSL